MIGRKSHGKSFPDEHGAHRVELLNETFYFRYASAAVEYFIHDAPRPCKLILDNKYIASE